MMNNSAQKIDQMLQQRPVTAPAAMPVTVPVLNVEKSVLGKKWVMTPADPRMSVAISQSFGLSDVIGRLLAGRGIGVDDVDHFLQPALKTAMPDPYVLQDMEAAANRIADAIMARENVAVFGDYDVDGATSTALLMRYFRALGQHLRIYIPDRLKEGYGPNATALQKLRSEGASLLLTVDCGVTAFDALDAGVKAGLDIVVLDHHRAEPQLPAVTAVVNPNRLDDTSGLQNLAAVGVVFLTLVAVNRILRQRGFFAGKISEPRILGWLDLVALGTVCDIVPLTGLNRAYVAQGLRVMALRQNAGITALCDLNKVTEAPNTFHCGFVIGPRVNAGGRVGESSLGARLLATEDPVEARQLAELLNGYNADRRAIEEQMIADAMEKATALADRYFSIVVDGDGWHPGVIGIVAARLKEKFNRPVSVVAFDESGIGKASCRSVSGVDLGGGVIAAKQAGLLVAGGGHKMAAGFTVARDNLEALREFLDSHARAQVADINYVPELRIDAVLSGHALTLPLVEDINRLGPFGAGNPEPRFAIAGVKIVKPKVVGENHVSFFLQDSAGGAAVKAIAFRAMDTALGETLLTAQGKLMNVAGQATLNTWMGKTSVNLQVVDACAVLDHA